MVAAQRDEAAPIETRKQVVDSGYGRAAIELFKQDAHQSGSVFPIAFPLIAGAGSITTILSLKAEYQTINIFIALVLNMGVIYLVLRLTSYFERILGKSGLGILKKVFGVILLSIAIKLFLTNTGITIINAR